MNETNDIMEKLDYEEPRLLELNFGGLSIVAGTSPLEGQDPDIEDGDNAAEEEN